MTKAIAVESKLRELKVMKAAQLRREWASVFREKAPMVSSNLLRLALGYEVQQRAFGKLPATYARVLRQEAELPKPKVELKLGTRLLREWNGRMHSVLVTEDGFEFDGKAYPTLSAVAVKITGAHWSGPRFFGLRKRSAPQKNGRAIDE